MEPREITIDGITYELRPWDAVDGERWLVKLLMLIGKSAGAFESDAVAIGAMIGVLDEATVLAFWATCRKYTVLVGEDNRPGHEGERTEFVLDRKPLRAVAPFAMFKLMREHAEGQYGDFFARLPELLGLSQTGESGSQSPPA